MLMSVALCGSLRAALARAAFRLAVRQITTSAPRASHDNPLGLPRNDAPPQLPRRARGLPQRRRVPYVRRTVVVSSGKGGVGKSTVAVNLALALSLLPAEQTQLDRRLRVGILDLDIFGPSIPKLMRLERAGEPALSDAGSLLPLTNHGVPSMSMGYLLPPAARAGDVSDAPIVWRGLMVQKATQQLLFEVDWRAASPAQEPLDVLVIDMPPGTGDVALSLTQLVELDAALVVSTPQEVALIDARRGVRMFQKVDVKIAGLVLNMSHFVSPTDGASFPLFGPPHAFDALASELGAPVLARVPLEPHVAAAGDAGQPAVLGGGGAGQSETVFLELGRRVWAGLAPGKVDC